MVLNAFFVEERNDSFKLNLNVFFPLCASSSRENIPVNILHFERDRQNIDLPAIKINSSCDR